MKTVFLKAFALVGVLFAANAFADTLYFLPPNEPEWLRRTPHLVFPAKTPAQEIPMKIDVNLCGWYKVYVPAADLGQVFIIHQGGGFINKRSDMLGYLGLTEDAADWQYGFPALENLQNMKDNVAATNILYFDPKGGLSGWGTARPAADPTGTRCNYRMATLIYDTHDGNIASFEGPGNGVEKGIVQPTLAKNASGIPKMQFRETRASKWDATALGQAFNCSPGRNAMLCYDMPFSRDKDGSWTFDSYYLCLDGGLDLNSGFGAEKACIGRGGLAAGMYPDRVNGKWPTTNPDNDLRGKDDKPPLDPTCSYNTCTNCARTTSAGRFVTYSGVDSTCFLKGLRNGCEPPYHVTNSKNTPFGDGDFVSTPPGGGTNWGDYGGPPGSWQPPLNNFWGSGVDMRNLYYCIESHASFIYEKGQEFIFSGDDDIWVFINNNLVIDLGGCHMATPGYVNLDYIGRSGSRWYSSWEVSERRTYPQTVYDTLIPGNEYQLDIFFCDRRKTHANARISTNMYITQENGLIKKGDGIDVPAEVCLTQDASGTCSALLSGGGYTKTEKCADELLKVAELKYKVVNRAGTAEFPLEPGEYCESAPPSQNWSPNAPILRCFGGIELDTHTGKVRVFTNLIQGLSGKQFVFAELTKESADRLGLKPPPEPVVVVEFTVRSDVRMVYGKIIDERNRDLVPVNFCQQEMEAITGTFKQICIGGASGTSSPFTVDPENAPNAPFRITASPSGLEVYTDSIYNGNHYPSSNRINLDSTLTLPSSSFMILWVTGASDQKEDPREYAINANGRNVTERVKFISRLPMIRWVYANNSIVPVGENKGSARDTLTNLIKSVYLGEAINLRIEAYDDYNSPYPPCLTCNIPNLTYEVNYDSMVGGNIGNLIDVSGNRDGVVNGYANLFVSGRPDAGDNRYIRLTINGPGDKQKIVWDSLQFKKPPVPYPTITEIYDTDGDGIGDSLVIVYSRIFDKDSLPNMIEVFWDPDTTLHFGITDRFPIIRNGDTVGYEYRKPNDAAYYGENRKYWEQYLRLDKKYPTFEERDSLKKEDKTAFDTIVFYLKESAGGPLHFSKEIRTRSDGRVSSWATFSENAGDTLHLSFNKPIADKIPAIVIYAKYEAGKQSGCGGNSSAPCKDQLVIKFSEPVMGITGSSLDDAKNSFSYMLRDIGDKDWKVLDQGSLPIFTRWSPSGLSQNASSKGDTEVNLTFDRWRDGSGASSRTPMPSDSIKFAVLPRVLMDLDSNTANPKEIGTEIEGRKPFMAEKIVIGEVDPNADVAENTKRVIDSIGGKPPKDLFSKSRPVEILPVPRDWSAVDVAKNYPGTIGMLFNPDIENTIKDMCVANANVTEEDIVLYARAFYHTNLGDYVANRGMSLKCSDPIFPGGSCLHNKNKVYFAWDMKDAKGRWAGTGAYVGLYDFRWEINNSSCRQEKFDNIERKVEMHGVKRIRKR